MFKTRLVATSFYQIEIKCLEQVVGATNNNLLLYQIF